MSSLLARIDEFDCIVALVLCTTARLAAGSDTLLLTWVMDKGDVDTGVVLQLFEPIEDLRCEGDLSEG